MNFPKNLRYLRKKCGLKQDDMLGYLRITRSTWSNYEIGFTHPKLIEIINISKFFGITLDQLVMQDLETVDPLPKKRGQRVPREYLVSDKSSLVNEPDIIYVLQELDRLRDELNNMKDKDRPE